MVFVVAYLSLMNVEYVNGDNSSCNNISLSFGDFSPEAQLMFYMLLMVLLHQLDVTGLALTGGSGGAAEDAGFEVTVGGTTVIGFSLEGNTIPRWKWRVVDANIF